MKEPTAKDFNKMVAALTEDAERKQSGALIWMTIVSLLMILIVCCFTLPPVIGVMTARYEYFDQETRVPIASLADSSVTSGEIHGGFLMISGRVSEDPYFYYYAGTNQLKLERAPAKNSFIIRDEKISPYVIIREHLQRKNTLFTDKGIGEPIVEYQPACSGECWGVIKPVEYEFHVPADSVVTTYNLDTNMET